MVTKYLLPQLSKPRRLTPFENRFYNLFEDPEEVKQSVEPLSLVPKIRRTFMRQKFGIEIELDNFPPREAKVFLEQLFSAEPGKYAHGYWTVRDHRYRPWEVKRDGSVEHGFEIASPPLTFDDLHLIKQIFYFLPNTPAKAQTHTGIHIHVGARGWTPKQLVNLIFLYANYSAEIAKALSITSRRRRRFCKSIVPFAEKMREKPPTLNQLKMNWYSCNSMKELRKLSAENKRKTRYSELNLHRYFETRGTSENTFEFRAFNSTTDWRTLQAYILFILAGVSFAKHLPTSPKLASSWRLKKVYKDDFLQRAEEMMRNYAVIERELCQDTKLCFERNFR